MLGGKPVDPASARDVACFGSNSIALRLSEQARAQPFTGEPLTLVVMFCQLDRSISRIGNLPFLVAAAAWRSPVKLLCLPPEIWPRLFKPSDDKCFALTVSFYSLALGI